MWSGRKGRCIVYLSLIFLLRDDDGIQGSKKRGAEEEYASFKPSLPFLLQEAGESGEDQSFMPQAWLVFRQASMLQDL